MVHEQLGWLSVTGGAVQSGSNPPAAGFVPCWLVYTQQQHTVAGGPLVGGDMSPVWEPSPDSQVRAG